MARQRTSNNSNRTSNNSNRNSNKREQAAPADSGIIFKVEHVRDWGRNGGISFSLRIEGSVLVEIYGCRIINGRDGEFVSFPQRKGNDGRYYKHAYVQLTDDQTDEIVSAVYDALED